MRAYLIAYNGLLAAGWISVLYLMIKHFIQGGSSGDVFKPVSFMLKLSQTAAVMEVVHCALRIVPSSVFLTFFQVASRLFVLWPVTVAVPEVQSSYGIILYLICWTVTEIIRYSYYLFNLLHSVPDMLVWCRYTFFIFLYPLGITGELVTIYQCFLSVKETGQFNIDLPNSSNFGFSYAFFLVIVMLSYIPIFPQLYFHMFAQRAKILGKPKTS